MRNVYIYTYTQHILHGMESLIHNPQLEKVMIRRVYWYVYKRFRNKSLVFKMDLSLMFTPNFYNGAILHILQN